MPADFSNYIDVIPEDVTPGDIYVGAIELARLSVPEFKVRQGTPEDALLQAAAHMNHLAISHFNRLPPRLMEGVAKLLGVRRTEGNRSTVEVTITLNQDTGIVIPAGSKFYYKVLSGDQSFQYVYENTQTIAVADWSGTPAAVSVILKSSEVALHPVVSTGTEFTSQSVIFEIDSVYAQQSGMAQAGTSTSITLAATASVADDYYNANTITILSGTGNSATAVTITDYVGSTRVATVVSWPSGTPDATSVYKVDSTYVNGGNPEGGLTYLSRARTHIEGLSTALTKASHVKASLMTNKGVIQRAKVYDLTDYTGTYPRLISAPNDLGQITVWAYGNNRQLTTAERSEMATYVADRAVAGLTVGCLEMELIDVDVSVNVKYSSAFSATVTSQLVEDAILQYLSPLDFTGRDEGWSEGDVAARVMNVSGVLYVESCTFSVASGNSNTGTAYSSLYQINASGRVEFLAKGVLPSCTSANLTKTLTAVTVT
jgi:hypothetical protein